MNLIVPIMPVGTEVQLQLGSDSYVLTVTSYEVERNSETSAIENLKIVVKISSAEEAKLKQSLEVEIIRNQLNQLLDTTTANLFPSKPWASYEALNTLRKIVVKSDYELIRFRTLGKKSLAELKEKLSGLGLTTEMKNLPPDPDKNVIA